MEVDVNSNKQQDFSSQICELMEVDQTIYQVGDWIVVRYDNIWHPGQIQRVNKSELITKFLHRSRNRLFWPKKKDVQYVDHKQILCKMNLPKKITKKGYTIKEDYYQSINTLSADCLVYEP